MVVLTNGNTGTFSMVSNRLFQIPTWVYFVAAVTVTLSLNLFVTEEWGFYFRIAIWCFLASLYCPYNSWFVKTTFAMVGSVQVFNGLWSVLPSDIPWIRGVLQFFLFYWITYLLVLRYDLPDDRLDDQHFFVLRKKEKSFKQFCRTLCHPFLRAVIYCDGHYYSFLEGKYLQKTPAATFEKRAGYKLYHIKRGPPINEAVLARLESRVGKPWSWTKLLLGR